MESKISANEKIRNIKFFMILINKGGILEKELISVMEKTSFVFSVTKNICPLQSNLRLLYIW